MRLQGPKKDVSEAILAALFYRCTAAMQKQCLKKQRAAPHPSASSMTSSNSDSTSPEGCSRLMTVVEARMSVTVPRYFITLKVVALSKPAAGQCQQKNNTRCWQLGVQPFRHHFTPVLMSSSRSRCLRPTNSSPQVRRRLWPPLMPRVNWSPTMVSAQVSRPSSRIANSIDSSALFPSSTSWSRTSSGCRNVWEEIRMRQADSSPLETSMGTHSPQRCTVCAPRRFCQP